MNQSEFGDFQTPPALVTQIIGSLGSLGKRWPRVLEPTCGKGNFIRGVLESDCPPEEIVGLEIQDRYIDGARSLSGPGATLISILKADIFRTHVGRDVRWKNSGPLLVVGNPPWVTNSAIGAINGKNLPRKTNFAGLRGIDAITGRSNFDIAEYIWIKLISELEDEDVTYALLCKTSVARKVLGHLHRNRRPVGRAEIRQIDAARWFGVSADACLFILSCSERKEHNAVDATEAHVFASLHSSIPGGRLGFVRGRLVADLQRYESVSHIEGKSPLEWRQGVKHDAAPVLELISRAGQWYNGYGETVEIEDDFVFPLFKSSDLKPDSGSPPCDRAVILPQASIGQETRLLTQRAPRLWSYLQRHQSVFEARKSSIYRNKPPFSIFGIGPYSFAPFKVLISGLHKEFHFTAVGSVRGKPCLCDDTCYLLPCDSGLQAAVAVAILNHPVTLEFIRSIAFQDAKRPITKTLLERIDLASAARVVPFSEVLPAIEETMRCMLGDRPVPVLRNFDLVACLQPDTL